jgi:hypothetical protein
MVSGDTLADDNQASLQICTWRPSLCGSAGQNRASLGMHFEDLIKQVSRYAIGVHDDSNMEFLIEQVGRSTWRQQSFQLAARNRASQEIHLVAVIM